MPAQPFLEWLHGVDPTGAELTLEDLRREPTIYLLPECENEEAARGCLRDVCEEIFEEQLDGLVPCAVVMACPPRPRRVHSVSVR
jgi:hypothetical protein